jgi:hypothetical protein
LNVHPGFKIADRVAFFTWGSPSLKSFSNTDLYIIPNLCMYTEASFLIHANISYGKKWSIENKQNADV